MTSLPLSCYSVDPSPPSFPPPVAVKPYRHIGFHPDRGRLIYNYYSETIQWETDHFFQDFLTGISPFSDIMDEMAVFPHYRKLYFENSEDQDRVYVLDIDKLEEETRHIDEVDPIFVAANIQTSFHNAHFGVCLCGYFSDNIELVFIKLDSEEVFQVNIPMNSENVGEKVPITESSDPSENPPDAELTIEGSQIAISWSDYDVASKTTTIRDSRTFTFDEAAMTLGGFPLKQIERWRNPKK